VPWLDTGVIEPPPAPAPHRHRHRLAVRHRNHRPAGRPRPATPPGADQRDEGRPRLRGDRRHPDPHRPGRRRPALLLRQAPPPRHELAGHRQPMRRHPVGVLPAARRRARPDRREDLGHHRRAGRRRG
jgi:hypothetical protein